MKKSAFSKQKPLLVRRGKQTMLILSDDDPENEAAFELEHMLSLKPSQRYKIMSKLFRQGRKMLVNNDNKKTPALIART